MYKLVIAFIMAAVFYAGGVFAAVNVNTANANELTGLSGIGPAKAQAIIQDRKKNGTYKQLDQLTRVNGIGDKTVDSLRSGATVGAQAQNNSHG